MHSKHPSAFRRLAAIFPLRWLALLAAFLSLHARAASVWQINLVGDLYPEGREVRRPTPDNPVYYYPIVHGFTEMGAKIADDNPPPAKEIVHQLAAVLSAQGYRVTKEIEVPAKEKAAGSTAHAKAFSPPPSLILVFNWGSLRAEKLDTNDDVTTSTPPAVLNQNQMIGLIAGKNFDSIVDFGTRTEEILDGIQDDRYFVMVAAYDFNAYMQQHKRVRLWVAKMSITAAGVTMPEVMPSLIKSGGELFGRETTGPKVIDLPNAREGRVDVGTPTVIEPKK